MRGFLILTAAVLFVIGAGVGILSAKPETYGPIACSSVRDCVDIARAFGIDSSLVTPTNPDIRFEEGSVFPPFRWLGWSVFLIFADSQRINALQWRMSSRATVSYSSCGRVAHEVPLEAGGLKFCDFYDSIALFAKDKVEYSVLDFTPPESSSGASRRAWLLRQLSQLRSW